MPADPVPSVEYAAAQLARARQQLAHADADVRARATARVAQWEGVIAGMLAGGLQIGSRTPTTAPAWVTLEVATGGFATGAYAAGGPLSPAEVALAARVGVPADRAALNLHFATSPELAARLADGRYRLALPEEGALLVLAWLRGRDAHDAADALLATLLPWFSALRFYPLPTDAPPTTAGDPTRATVQAQAPARTIAQLAAPRAPAPFVAMRDAILVWRPLRDRAHALLSVAPPARDDAWRAAHRQLVADVTAAGAPTTARGRLVHALVAALADAELPEARRRHLTRHAPRPRADSAAVAAPPHAPIRDALVARLRAGTTDAALLAPVDGAAVPAYLARTAARSLDGTLDELIALGALGSSEVLAAALPQLTGPLRARALPDLAARRLYAQLYAAFRRRRGLLLLHYQTQVRVHELPWIAALEAARAAAGTADARAALTDVVASALGGFPATITPNKLVAELAALAQTADLALPLVEELAVDIFMGSFSEKFARAARIAGRVVAGTLYARYYGIDADELARLPAPSAPPTATAPSLSPALAALCVRRAGALAAGPHTARNGTIIEQAQIVTTHNLAVLIDALPLRERLPLPALADACWRVVIRHLRVPPTSRHRSLLALKDAAYAWRQLVFFLSLAPTDAQARFVSDAHRRAAGVSDTAVRSRLARLLAGLARAMRGEPPTHVFTGWVVGPHWLLGEA